MGLLSICLDLQYITTSGLWFPWATLVNELIGYLICMAVFAYVAPLFFKFSLTHVRGIYYGNGKHKH
jgi:hypothetical protein